MSMTKIRAERIVGANATYRESVLVTIDTEFDQVGHVMTREQAYGFGMMLVDLSRTSARNEVHREEMKRPEVDIGKRNLD